MSILVLFVLFLTSSSLAIDIPIKYLNTYICEPTNNRVLNDEACHNYTNFEEKKICANILNTLIKLQFDPINNDEYKKIYLPTGEQVYYINNTHAYRTKCVHVEYFLVVSDIKVCTKHLEVNYKLVGENKLIKGYYTKENLIRNSTVFGLAETCKQKSDYFLDLDLNNQLYKEHNKIVTKPDMVPDILVPIDLKDMVKTYQNRLAVYNKIYSTFKSGIVDLVQDIIYLIFGAVVSLLALFLGIKLKKNDISSKNNAAELEDKLTNHIKKLDKIEKNIQKNASPSAPSYENISPRLSIQ